MTDQALAPSPRQGVIAKLADRYDMEAQDLGLTLKKTVFPNGEATVAQMQALCIVALEYDLNPLTKQIYAFPQKGGIVPIISVDGWYAIANRQEQFDGIEFEYHDDEKGQVVACTATIHRKDRAHPVRVTEYVAECKRNTPPWNQQPRRMIRHRAAIQGIRIAFGISAVDPEEAERMPEYEVKAEEDRRPEVQIVDDLRAQAGAAMGVEPPPKEPEEAGDPHQEEERKAPPEKEEKPRQRRRRANKAQREEFSTLLRNCDPALIAGKLPFIDEDVEGMKPEDDSLEAAFAIMWQDHAEALLARMRVGDFKAQQPDSAEEPEEMFEA